MSIRPDNLKIEAGARQADDIADLRRRLAILESARAVGIQRHYEEDNSEYFSSSTSWTHVPEPTITVTIPSVDSLIIVEWETHARKSGSNPSGEATLGLAAGADVPATASLLDGIYYTKSTVYAHLRPFYVTYGSFNNGALFPAASILTAITGQGLMDLEDSVQVVPGEVTFGFIQRVNLSNTTAQTKNRHLRIIVI